MIILSRKKIEVNDINFHEFIINADRGEDFSQYKTFYHENKKFKAYFSEPITYGLDKIYRVVAKYLPKTTKFNYDNTKFFHVSSIKREDALTVTIKQDNLQSTIVFETPEECLAEYLALKTIHKEAKSNEKYFKLEF